VTQNIPTYIDDIAGSAIIGAVCCICCIPSSKERCRMVGIWN